MTMQQIKDTIKTFHLAPRKLKEVLVAMCDLISAAGGSTSWGSIDGTLADQTDLQDALDLKQDVDSALVIGTTATTALAGNTPRLTPAQITAIAALTSASTAADIVAALQAT